MGSRPCALSGRTGTPHHRDEGSAFVEVTDAGGGVDAGLRERVFERFVQADSSRHGEGSGLGLAISRANARLLGGDLDLDADGRTFRLRLPLSLSPAEGD